MQVTIFCCIWIMIVLEGCSSLICLIVPRAHAIYSSIPFLDYYKFRPFLFYYFIIFIFIYTPFWFFSFFNILSGLIEKKNLFLKVKIQCVRRKIIDKHINITVYIVINIVMACFSLIYVQNY